MQPRIVEITAQNNMELNGFLYVVLTFAKVEAKGVALSLANVQNMRLEVMKTPMSARKFGKKASTSSPTVPLAEFVAWS